MVTEQRPFLKVHQFTIYVLLVIFSCPFMIFASTDLIGAGASFPYPFFAQAFSIYHRETGTRVNYQSIGSGAGINQIINRTVDFGGTDAYLSDTQIQQAGNEVLHIPMILGAVVISYNIPGNPPLNLTGEVLADIYMGNIRRWDDERITRLNPGHSYPAYPILVTHRSDGSGTTFIFSDYLSKISPEWAEKVGRGTSLRWPSGLGGRGNAGVAGLLTEIPGTIAYLERNYASQYDLPMASLQNKSGNFIYPDTESISLSADIDLPEDTRVSLTNSEAEYAYPICGFTWIVVYREQKYDRRTLLRARTLVNLLEWMIVHGQEYAVAMDYSPLPESAREKALNIIDSINFDGTPVKQQGENTQ